MTDQPQEPSRQENSPLKKFYYAEKEGKQSLRISAILLTAFIAMFVIYGAVSLFSGKGKQSSDFDALTLQMSANDIPATRQGKNAKPENLTISFNGPAAKLADLGKDLTQGFSLSPEKKGTWRWRSESQLVFTPAEDWPVGKHYEVDFERSFFREQVSLNSYDVDFKTVPFTYFINKSTFYQNPKRPVEKKVITEIHFSHPVDQKSLLKQISIQFKERDRADDGFKSTKNIKYTTSYNKYKTIAYIHTEILPMPDYNSVVVFEIDKGVEALAGGRASDSHEKKSTTVPGMLSFFKIKQAELTLVRNAEYDPEQVLILSSSAGINHQSLKKHLEVYLLPKNYRQPRGKKKLIENYNWRHHGNIPQAILNQSDKIKLNPIPAAFDYNKTLSYKYDSKPGRFVLIRILKGITSFGGYKLTHDRLVVAKIPEFPKELKIMAEGSLLSLSGDQKLSFLARNVSKVDVQIQRLLPNQIAHFVSQSNGDFGTPDFGYRFNLENIAETFHSKISLPNKGDGKTIYSYIDFNKIMKNAPRKPKGLFHIKTKNDDYRAYGRPNDSRFILITDLGILVKKAVNGDQNLFVQSVAAGTPVANAKVEVLGKNGLPIYAGKTNQSGYLKIPKLVRYREQAPTAYVVSKGEDLSFLPYNSHVTALNYSRYDIGGTYSNRSDSGLEGYIFSDRGIYRPGEKINIGYVVKHTNWSKNLKGTTLKMKVTNPKGNQIRNKTVTLNKVGLKGYNLQTDETWPTGQYKFTLYSKNRYGHFIELKSTYVKVEEFMPDRMKISAKFNRPTNRGWLKPKDLSGKVLLQNLFGTAAQNRKVRGEIALSPRYPSFYAYKDWTFHDPKRSKKHFSEQLETKTTDDEGRASFEFGLEKYESASYLLKFMAEGYEAEGGRSVLASNSVLISPLDYLIGYKPQGNFHYIKKGVKIGVDFIAVDQNLDKRAVKNLTLKTLEFKNVSTLVKQENGSYKYESVKKKVDKGSRKLSLAKKVNSIPLDTKTPGEYALLLLDKDGLELNRVDYSIAGDANLSFNLEKNAELKVKLNKSDYNPGEELEISIVAPYVGAGLITIERDQVYSYKWFKTNKKSSIQKITMPANMEGNGYVNVTFVRSLNSNEIFMSPLSTGVVPFSINKASRINTISLKVPELVRPGKALRMKVKTKKKGKLLLFAVDEGVLQVAKYTNPDPLNSFYKKKALEVTTRQILDLILPEFRKIEARRSRTGGGAESLLGKNLNPFKRKRDKAVAYWSGVIDAGPEEQTFTYQVPDSFSGRLRIIAVAVSSRAMDATSEKTTVKGNFVISPNVPTVIAPGDEFTISAGISNNVEKSGKNAKIELELITSKNIQVLDKKRVTLTINEGSESSHRFKVRASAPLGNASFQFKATHRGKTTKSSKRTATASLRPASAYITSLQTGVLKSKEDISLQTPRRMHKEFRNNQLSVSKLPTALINGLNAFLVKYPYGCTEQVTSKGFPALAFSDNPEFGRTKAEIAVQVEGILEIYASRQMPDGGFSMWPGGNFINPFHTVYATHYMAEASARGFQIPEELMRLAISYLKTYVASRSSSLNEARVKAYGAYVLALNGEIVTQSLTSMEQWLNGYSHSDWKEDILMLYMASAYKLMQADQKAEKILAEFKGDKTWDFFDYGYGVFDDRVRQATFIYLISKHFPKHHGDLTEKQVDRLVYGISGNYNTTSSALSVLAIEQYAKAISRDANTDILVMEVFQEKKTKLAMKGKLIPKAKFKPVTEKVLIDNQSNVNAYYSLVQEGFNLKPSSKETKKQIEVYREFVDADGNEITEAKLGEEITVRLRIAPTVNRSIYNVAIVDLLPGGFEAVLDSIDRRASGVTYVDVREDRLLLFVHLRKGQTTSYSYKIKAINKGAYQVPAIYAESMYDKKIWSEGKSSKIQVK